MAITLVVLAAGIGARYGAGIKQLEHVGPAGEIIMDFSIHDAIQAGFDRVVFIIRREIYDDFREVIGDRLTEKFRGLGVTWDYAFQEMDDVPPGRNKPWGTGQAILACKGLVRGPFAVINADDYYGKSAFEQAYRFLSQCRAEEPGRFGMIGFVLKNTLSDVGGVTRGLCETDGQGYLADIHETRGIVKTPEGAAVQTPEGLRPLDGDGLVSMNMWMLTEAFFDGLEERFAAFRANMKDPLKDEFLLPEVIGDLLREGKATVRVLHSPDQWFGVTYHEDKAVVAEAFRRLVAEGVYDRDLFRDIGR